ncbi:TPA: hypothetical protein QH084_000452 [Morganella morganii subsp. morganii]|uniref:hypothetical protein n=1 Tax=Morganella morganii TaxID=582 RepID=UPI001BDA9D00|nr:hypothetical protein [Morganella morganii]MBT0332006.1 hypothetical protein [Morganella morganii subsp. morganii]HDS6884646.1 hypothetical protein [Morganella morganii subsp. morganii]
MSETNKIQIIDIRMQRPILARIEDKDLTLTLQMSDKATLFGATVSFYTPNNVSIFLSSAKKEIAKSNSIYKSIFGKINKIKHKKLKLSDKDLPRLYNYFESVQLAIISMYTAIESFANICIPNDYVYEKNNSRGIKESYSKELIERYVPTSEKIDKILPLILNCDSPKGTKLWQNFKELESLRNDIIHPKTIKKNKEIKEDSSFLCILLSDNFIMKIASGFDLVSFFCKKDISHSLFPMGFGEIQFKSVPFIESNFEKVDDADEVELLS